MGLVRFRFCACRLRTNVPGPFYAVGAAFGRPKAFPLGEGAEQSEVDEVRRGGTPGRPKAFSPSEKGEGARPKVRRMRVGPETTKTLNRP